MNWLDWTLPAAKRTRDLNFGAFVTNGDSLEPMAFSMLAVSFFTVHKKAMPRRMGGITDPGEMCR